MPSLETNQLLRAAADACDSRKAEDIRILALDPAESSLTDYFLICSGTNERQNVAISDEIEFRLKKEFDVHPNSVEGRRQGEWVLMDYVDFVVHIFMPEKRAYYGLEQLRKSATTLSLASLDDEIKAAVSAARAKRPVRKPTRAEVEDESSAVTAPPVEKPKRAAKKQDGSTASTKVANSAEVVVPKKAPAKRLTTRATAKKSASRKSAQ